MNYKQKLALVTAIFLVSTSLFALQLPNTAQTSGITAQPMTNTPYAGNVTIYSNGTVSTGAPIQYINNDYHLTSGINGFLTIEHNGTVLNGNGYTVSTPFNEPAHGGINITGTSNVTLSNFSLNDFTTIPGIYISDSNNDTIMGMSIGASQTSILAANNTHDLNISNSTITDFAEVSNGMPIFSSLLLGIYVTGSGSISPSPTASGFHLYNDLLEAVGVSFDVVLGGPNSSITDSAMSDSGIQASVLAVSNNTLVSGNTINATYVQHSTIAVLPPTTGELLHNITVSNNVINATLAAQSEVVNIQGSGSISNNNVILNATGYVATALELSGGNTSVSGNTINLTNPFTSAKSTYGIMTTGDNYTISHNTVNISAISINGLELDPAGASASVHNSSVLDNSFNLISFNSNSNSRVKGIFSPVYLVNTNINGNTVNENGDGVTSINAGFQNASISDNSITIYDTFTFDGIDTSTLGTSYSNNISITGNTIFVSGPMITTSNPAISLGSPITDNVSVSNNRINVMQNDTHGYGIRAYYSNSPIYNVAINGNTVMMNGSQAYIYVTDSSYKVMNLSIVGNLLEGINGQANYGLYLNNVTSVSVYNNTVINSNNSLYIGYVDNITFGGNYFNDSSGYLILFNGEVSNVLFYHNDFSSYAHTVNVLGGSSLNLYYNLSLPVGGNYWSGYTGTDGNGDGIGDTPYSGVYFKDYLPLMTPWTRPNVTFSEGGLPSGTHWSVTFNGHTKTSEQSTITFNITNGTYQKYSYSISSVKGYQGGVKSDTFDYTGSSTNVSASYVHEYTIKFVESGLPSGYKWSVILNGTRHNITASSFEAIVTNGANLPYTVENTTLYYSNVHPGSSAINGANVTVDVSYAHYSYINGTVSPTASSVYINGHKVVVTNGTFNDTVTAGTYDVEVNDTGYVTYYDNFTISSGVTEPINVSLNRTNSAGTPSSNNSMYYYIAGGVAVVAIAAVAAYFLRKKPRQ